MLLFGVSTIPIPCFFASLRQEPQQPLLEEGGPTQAPASNFLYIKLPKNKSCE